jgi:hypothetical protein
MLSKYKFVGTNLCDAASPLFTKSLRGYGRILKFKKVPVILKNGIIEHGDVFALLYLRNVPSEGNVLVDKAPDARSDFIERYGTRFRECEGLMQEVLA